MDNPKVIPNQKTECVIRFLTFNVNGIRTFFHYHPFSEMNQSLANVFDYFDSDIITFQELKIDKSAVPKWGKVDGFSSFISIPVHKRGYSGVGCWVRNYPKEHPLHDKMQVLKAEEGITGMLTVKKGKDNVRYCDNPDIGIGGYESLGFDNNDEKEGLKLDSEGRCVMIELACNIVIINVYCPANSNLSEEGNLQRLKFLGVLFKRVRNLDRIGKNLVIMGDINICRDLFDHAESLEKASIFTNNQWGGIELEQKYRALCENFVLDPEAPHRRMFNQMLNDSIISAAAENGILIDTTRLIQTRRRLKMYTVWNTLKNARPVNYGSRIDFILASTGMKDDIKAANILPQVMGSDHCPVFTDLDIESFACSSKEIVVRLPRFEARHKYGLLHGNILEMFAKTGKPVSSKETEYRSRVFKKSSSTSKTSGTKEKVLTITENIKPLKLRMEDILGEPPLCNHGFHAILRTSKTKTHPGKKFWVCKLPNGSSRDENASCGFFQWV